LAIKGTVLTSLRRARYDDKNWLLGPGNSKPEYQKI
jgi:hypothetical protein